MSDRGSGTDDGPPGRPDRDQGRDRQDRRTRELQPLGEVWCGRHRVDPVFERDAERSRIRRQLVESGRSFAVVGPPGVGKTAILRGVLQELVTLPPDAAWRFVQTSANNVIAGRHYLGEWQGHVEKLIQIAQRRRRTAIWLTDLVQATKTGRSQSGDTSVLDFMATAIEQGRILVFGEATPASFEAAFARHPRLARMLDQVRIEPHPAAVNARVVAALAEQRLSHARLPADTAVAWTPAAVDRCVQLGQAFFPGQSPPGGAARLIDAVLEQEPLEGLVAAARPAAAEPPPGPVEIPPSSVVEALVRLTGAPRVMLDDSLPLAMADVRRFFERRIVGQRGAIDTIVDLVATIKAGLADPGRPPGVLLFVGPTGVGKTELARTLAEFVFGHADRLVRLDMSELARADAVATLLGHGHGHGEADGRGLLDRVHSQPFSVVLLDEIEKAHPAVFDLLLQLFDAGRLTRTGGETVDFTQTVIILTSNLGTGAPPRADFGFNTGEPPAADEWIRQAVQEFFRPELVNRIGRIVVFEPLSRADVRTLAQRELGHVLLRSGIVRRRVEVDVDRGVIDLIARAGYDPRMGARPLKRAVERLVVGPLAHVLAESGGDRVPTLVQVRPQGDRVRVQAIHDDHGRRHRPPSAAPKVTAPFDGRTRNATIETVRGWSDELRAAVAEARAAAAARGVADRRSEIVAATAAATFWDDQASARRQLAELYRLERLSEALLACATEADRLADAARRLDRQASPERLAALAREIDECHRQGVILRFAVLCDAPPRQGDAFVVYETRDPEARGHVAELAACHAGWAERLGYDFVRIHEEDGGGTTAGPAAQIVAQVNGAAAAGILEAEDGFHEFADGRSRNRMVKVTVMPAVADDFAADEVEITARELPRQGDGPVSRVRAVHRPSGLAVAIRSRHSRSIAGGHARELLAAEIARQEALHDKTDPPAIVRRWWLGDNPDVRDPRTGIVVSRIKDVQGGQIQPFLLAFLERRDAAAESRPTTRQG